MTELVCFAVFYVMCALVLVYRLYKGPSAVDRIIAGDSIDILLDVAMILFALYSGRGIYLDIAIVTALLGLISTVLMGKYVEGTL